MRDANRVLEREVIVLFTKPLSIEKNYSLVKENYGFRCEVRIREINQYQSRKNVP